MRTGAWTPERPEHWRQAPRGFVPRGCWTRRFGERAPTRAGSVVSHRMGPLQLFLLLGPLQAVLPLARHILTGSI